MTFADAESVTNVLENGPHQLDSKSVSCPSRNYAYHPLHPFNEIFINCLYKNDVSVRSITY